MTSGRYPRILAEEIFKRRIFWNKALKSLCEQNACEFDLSFERGGVLKDRLDSLQQKIKDTWLANTKNNALASQDRIYRLLDHSVRSLDLTAESQKASMFVLGWVCRARGDLLQLNGRPHSSDDGDGLSQACSLCNSGEKENMMHFLADCQVLGEFRMANFGSSRLSHEMVLSIMNGLNWLPLAKFCSAAWAYRSELVSHFNWDRS
ncbi:hypothetical protein GE061_014302 [Apolygus lucorum]|uniref:Uncharacterized protein n=1 Tax=Apolygus lucorum TaxID=248454 RepID=A0A8S9WRG0_APOLU|nr:hypothetical protein GE061_006837 [Apolygus lucorum]KAF6211187.1 hypothetical protein GE061_014302 [Apolygus lucorum]